MTRDIPTDTDVPTKLDIDLQPFFQSLTPTETVVPTNPAMELQPCLQSLIATETAVPTNPAMELHPLLQSLIATETAVPTNPAIDSQPFFQSLIPTETAVPTKLDIASQPFFQSLIPTETAVPTKSAIELHPLFISSTPTDIAPLLSPPLPGNSSFIFSAGSFKAVVIGSRMCSFTQLTMSVNGFAIPSKIPRPIFLAASSNSGLDAGECIPNADLSPSINGLTIYLLGQLTVSKKNLPISFTMPSAICVPVSPLCALK